MEFSINDFFNKCDQIRSFLRIWSYLLKKSLMENSIFDAVVQKWSIGVKWVNLIKATIYITESIVNTSTVFQTIINTESKLSSSGESFSYRLIKEQFLKKLSQTLALPMVTEETPPFFILQSLSPYLSEVKVIRSTLEMLFNHCITNNTKTIFSIQFTYNLTLCKKSPYSEFFWYAFPHIRTKYGPEKLRIRTLFTQCESLSQYACSS